MSNFVKDLIHTDKQHEPLRIRMDICEFLYTHGPQKAATIESACNLQSDLCKRYLTDMAEHNFIRKNESDEYQIMINGVDYLTKAPELFPGRKAVEVKVPWTITRTDQPASLTISQPILTCPDCKSVDLRPTPDMKLVYCHNCGLVIHKLAPSIRNDTPQSPTSPTLIPENQYAELRSWLDTKFQTIDKRFTELEKSFSENKQTKIRKAWYRTLLGITELGGKTGTEQLADHLRISRSVISEYLNRMEEEGLVTRGFNDDSKSGSRFVWQIEWNALSPEISSRLRK